MALLSIQSTRLGATGHLLSPLIKQKHHSSLVVRGEHTFGMPTQMFLTSNFSGNSISGESGGIVVESFLSRPWRMPV